MGVVQDPMMNTILRNSKGRATLYDSTQGRIHRRRPTAMVRFSLATPWRTRQPKNPVNRDLTVKTVRLSLGTKRHFLARLDAK
jgi:hypothetical protein